MKELFQGYFKENEAEITELWDNCYFAFDANILLNLYRYSDTTRREFIKVLTKIKERIWLPHRSAEEYFNNRLSVIDKQERSYDETLKSINSLESDLENAWQHPFVSNNIMKRAKSVFKDLCKELEDNRSIHTNRIGNDEIQNSIATLFNKNTGTPFTREELEKILKEGEERYKEKIPPGFKDGSKHSDSEVFNEKCKKYGDFIVWTQVIGKSKEVGRSMIFVTDDRKEDWWTIFKGKTLGPRPELIKEFKEKTNNSFYMYQADRFLELARENLNEDVSEEIVKEIREVRRRDKIANKKNIDRQRALNNSHHFNSLMKEAEAARSRLMQLSEERKLLQMKQISLGEEREQIQNHREGLMTDSNRAVEIEPLMRHFYKISDEYELVQKEMHMLSAHSEEIRQKIKWLENEASQSMNELNFVSDKY